MTPLMEKLLKKRFVLEATGCWLWTGAQKEGYGVTWIDGKREYVHRLSYIETRGMPENLVLHVLSCKFRNCFNPKHLYDGTIQDNMKDRGLAGTTKNPNMGKTHCKWGHEFTPENTSIRSTGARNCKICQKIRDSIRYQTSG